jgi:hypothetical protein
MKKEVTITSPTGFEVTNYGQGYCLTGFPRKEYRFRDFSDCYDVESMLEEKVKLPDSAICDSESCQLYILFDTKASALSYLKRVEKYLEKVKELV